MEEFRFLVVGLIASGVGAALVLWAARDAIGSEQAPGNRDNDTASFGKRSKIVAALYLTISIFLFYASSRAPEAQRLYAAALTCVLVLFFLAQLLDRLMFKIKTERQGLVIESAWRKARKIPWSEFNGYKYYKGVGLHVFHTKNSGSVKIHDNLMGSRKVLNNIKKMCDTA